MSDYETRAQTLGLANPEELKQAMLVENSVLLDVRSDEEIEQSGRFEKEGHKWVQSPCTRTECAMLSKSYEELFPDKKAPIIVYCRSGGRAVAAKNFLQDHGYQTVLNAGGYDDMKVMGL